MIVFREVTLLRNPELDSVVLNPEEQEAQAAEESEDKWNDDDWHGLLTGHNTEPDIDKNGKFQNRK